MYVVGGDRTGLTLATIPASPTRTLPASTRCFAPQPACRLPAGEPTDYWLWEPCLHETVQSQSVKLLHETVPPLIAAL